VPLAHATDGGGSIRIPASANGIFGLKPTRGRVSNGPIVDEIWSGFVVQLGVSRTVRDSAALLDIAQGGGVGEPYFTDRPDFTYLSQVSKDPRPLKIGVMKDPPNGRRSAAAVSNEVMRTAALCENLGHKVELVEFNSGVSWEAFVFANAQIWTSNTTAWIDVIAQITGRIPNANNLEAVTRAAYEYGKRASALDLLGALDVRNTVSRALAAYFQSYDLLLTPTLPDVPAIIGQLYEGIENLDGLGWVDRVFNNSPFTALANVSGVPAMSVPLGVDSPTGLPIGSQFFAPFGDEATLFSLAGQLERASPWIERHPTVWAGTQL
jgi:amidase